MIDRLRSAVCWSGTDVTLSMFLVSRTPEVPALTPLGMSTAGRLRAYELEDETGVLGGLHVYEFDFVFQEFPPDLDHFVTESLVAALKEGALVAWFGFEGSFDFEYLLHPEIARQVYAIAIGEVLRLALEDEYRSSPDWQQLLSRLRKHIVR